MKKIWGTTATVVITATIVAMVTGCSMMHREIDRDGRFIAYHDGTVLDTKTKLMWAATDNGSDLNWAYAQYYCENYRQGGYTDWRMPTQDELEGLYDAAKAYKSDCGFEVHLTELIRLTCVASWASGRRGSAAPRFRYYDGTWYWYHDWSEKAARVLPVRRSGR